MRTLPERRTAASHQVRAENFPRFTLPVPMLSMSAAAWMVMAVGGPIGPPTLSDLSPLGRFATLAAYIARWLSVSRSVMWWIGDWLRFGERRWGEMYAQAVDDTRRQYQQLADAKWVAEKFDDFSCRHENLSWSHHREVAGLASDKRDELLDLAEREGLSTRELRAEVSRRKAARVIGASMTSTMSSSDRAAICRNSKAWRRVMPMSSKVAGITFPSGTLSRALS